jgi:hypothetical protein
MGKTRSPQLLQNLMGRKKRKNTRQSPPALLQKLQNAGKTLGFNGSLTRSTH